MSKTDFKEALNEARDLIDGISDVTADGRRLANDLGETIRNFTAMQCDAIEARVAELRRRLELLEKKA